MTLPPVCFYIHNKTLNGGRTHSALSREKLKVDEAAAYALLEHAA